jgi:hypothetical protein
MECDAIVQKTNETPLIYNHLSFKEGGQEQFLKELSDLYNKFGLDSRLNVRDFLLAEMTFNFLAVINNTIDKEFEMKVCNEPETIKISDCNPKAHSCVLTNHGIDTNIVKFD